MIERKIAEKFDALITEGDEIANARVVFVGGDFAKKARCTAWFASAMNLLNLVVPDGLHPYRSAAASVEFKGRLATVPEPHVAEMAALLRVLKTDLDAGLVNALSNTIRGEVYEDLLKHAEAYHKAGKKEGSGVLGGVVFEDTVRRIASFNQVTDRDIEQIIITLRKNGVLNEAMELRCRAAAGVRTHATHADWGKFDLPAVGAAIKVTRELIQTHLKGSPQI